MLWCICSMVANQNWRINQNAEWFNFQLSWKLRTCDPQSRKTKIAQLPFPYFTNLPDYQGNLNSILQDCGSVSTARPWEIFNLHHCWQKVLLWLLSPPSSLLMVVIMATVIIRIMTVIVSTTIIIVSLLCMCGTRVDPQFRQRAPCQPAPGSSIPYQLTSSPPYLSPSSSSSLGHSRPAGLA